MCYNMVKKKIKGGIMEGLNISEECQKEWEQTLNVNRYREIDESLAVKLAKFLSETDISKIQNNTSFFSDIVKDLAKIMGVTIRDIKFVQDEKSSIVGGYISDNKSIVFNLSAKNLMRLSKAELLTTITHELRHAQQHQLIVNMRDSEIAKKMTSSLKNYTQPDGSIIKDAKYFSNFSEVDAELFSHVYVDNILSQLQDKNFLREYQDVISDSVMSHSSSHAKFKKQLEESLKVVEINNTVITNITKLVTNYAGMINMDERLSPEQMSMIEEAMISQCEIIFGGKAKEFVDFTDSHFKALQIAMYENVDVIKLANNLDRPFIKYFEKLEDKYDRFALDKYGKFTRRLKRIVEDGKKFLNSHEVLYNEKDNGNVIEKVISSMPRVYLENFVSPKNKEQMNRDYDMCALVDIYITRDKNYLHKQCAKYIEENLPKEEIRKRLEDMVDNENSGNFGSDIIRDLLDGYAQDYSTEKIFHSREKFLNFMGVKCKTGEFSEIYDKFDEQFPKFIAKSLFKSKLTEEEKQYLTSFSLGSYRNINIDKLK